MGSDYQGFFKSKLAKKENLKKKINILNHHFGQMPKN